MATDDVAATPGDDPPTAGSSEIDMRVAAGVRPSINVDWMAENLRRAADLLARLEGVEIARLSVLIVDDARMTHLHERHSGMRAITDVLTFDLRKAPMLPVEADLVICADEGVRRAAEFGHDLERELLLYCVHGLLHCLGHDDHDEEAWRSMHAREDQILRDIGVGATFERSPAPPEGPR